MTAPDAALDLLAGMVLEDGRPWADTATTWQWDCARTLLDPEAPPFRWESRPRGGSKTTDVAGICLAAMLTQLPAGTRADAYAGDRDQARLLVDALAGLVARTPALTGVVTVDQYAARTAGGVVLEVMAADAASAHGRRPAWAVVDEVCQWPRTRNARTLWEVVYSSLGKVPGARLAVITTSGDPAHWARQVRDVAMGSPLWSVAEIPGPLPWVDPVYLDGQRQMLPESSFARLHLNEWAAPEDRLVSPDDLAAAVTLAGPLSASVGFRYCIGLDVGLTNDRTVAVVCHAEPLTDGREGSRVVLDRIQVWAGSRVAPVELGEVEAWLLHAHESYGKPQLIADPWQSVGLCQRLRAAGVAVEEFTFSAQSVGRVAAELMRALRDRRLALPDDPELLEELGSVRLRETTPGVLRLDHDASGHDDRAVALGLAVLTLTQQPVAGRAVHAYDEGLDPDRPIDLNDLPDAFPMPSTTRELTPAQLGYGTWANTSPGRRGPWWLPA